VIHYWGYKEKQFIYYVLAPSWVPLLVNDIVNMCIDDKLLDEKSDESLSEKSDFKEIRRRDLAK